MGGSVTSESIRLFGERQERLGDRISSMETRKVVLPTDRMLNQKNALEEALRIEEYYLRFKLECETWFSQADQERLAKLKTRL